MSMRFRLYADKLNQAVLEYRNSLSAAQKARDAAQKAFDEAQAIYGVVPRREPSEDRRERESRLADASENLDRATAAFQRIRSERALLMARVEEIRADLERDVIKYFSADPAYINQNTIILLNSGILTAAEYEHLSKDAASQGNYTMARIIAEYAARYLKTCKKNHPDTEILENIIRETSSDKGKMVMENYDALVNCVRGVIGNLDDPDWSPDALDRWEEFTGQAIKEF